MDDSSFVRGVERIGDLPRDRERLWNRQALDSCLTSGELVREGVPFDQLQDQRRNAVRLLDAVDRTDMRMIEGREQAGFTLEPGETVGIRRERRRQDLDRDVASQLRVRARYTSPMPPSPIRAEITYGPSFWPIRIPPPILFDTAGVLRKAAPPSCASSDSTSTA